MKRHLIIYIALQIVVLNAFAQSASLRKLSPSVRQVVYEQQMAQQPAKSLSQDALRKELCAFVKVDGDAEEIFARYNTRLLASFGNIHIVSIPHPQITALASDHRVLKIEAGRGVDALNHDMPRHLNIDKVYEGTALPQAFTGRVVVMGIQDMGFDLTKPNF